MTITEKSNQEIHLGGYTWIEVKVSDIKDRNKDVKQVRRTQVGVKNKKEAVTTKRATDFSRSDQVERGQDGGIKAEKQEIENESEGEDEKKERADMERYKYPVNKSGEEADRHGKNNLPNAGAKGEATMEIYEKEDIRKLIT